MKILNLDKVTPPSAKGITILGTNYPIPEITVESFLISVKKAQDLKSGAPQQEMTAEERVEDAVKFVCSAIPSLPKAVAQKLSFEQLHMVIAFINGLIDEEGQPPASDEGAPEGEPEGNAVAPA